RDSVHNAWIAVTGRCWAVCVNAWRWYGGDFEAVRSRFERLFSSINEVILSLPCLYVALLLLGKAMQY
ncbi:hypothetical protein ACSOL8_004743, partial [Salmonella enterica subsp. enterica serovar Newport]